MNEVMLVKVTLNEATDPDLFAYIMRYENPRLRAGAFRSLARAALLNSRSRSEAEAIRVVEQPSLAKPLSSALPGSGSVQTDEIGSMSDPRPAPVLTNSHETAAPAPEADRGYVQRFDTDAIADQFAQF
jgi:hypothetical protein